MGWKLVQDQINRKKDGNGWENHPATKMWRGYTKALRLYHDTIITEWVERGYENNMDLFQVKKPFNFPQWLGDNRLHRSHKSNLLRKGSEYYGQFNWDVPDNLDYF